MASSNSALQEGISENKSSNSTASLPNGEKDSSDRDAEANVVAVDADENEPSWFARNDGLVRRWSLLALAALILGWWISATVLHATRHRWVVQTFLAWSFIAIIAFRFIPNSVVTRPVEAVWAPVAQRPFFALPRYVRYGMGWLALLAIVLGSAFGFKLENGTNYGDRAISVLGLLVFQFGFWATSRHRSHIQWRPVIIGLFMQQAIALFVLKSGAGFHIFRWLANLASDFLAQGLVGAAFFFDQDTVDTKHWFFVNVLATIIFFIAFVQMFYHLGVMQWIIKHFAWFFFKTMNVSGAEAVVAAASPFLGQGESACLVRPYVDFMTESEIHLIMTSGFSTIAGSVMSAYISLGVPAQNLITASMMSIPASIAISKLRMPEMDEPLTRGQVVVDRGEESTKNAPVNALHAFAKGAIFGLVVAGQILCNVLTILSLVATINGVLTWVGRGFGIHHLTIQLVLRYVFYPITFFLGVPRSDILRVSELLATKLVENEFAAYLELQALMASPDALSKRGYAIASYALCGFANLGSLGIQIGVLSALAPSRTRLIATIGLSAMICGFISTLQAAGIAGMLV
ncbi:Na+ dependent nucleoside transporter C-terminus-domain-containing protein [Russula earlei]|uniref:Na+ dependent nucleoside transporter C-terminus-domain-containing protein n=1 Tax=Russula earlei TaxID=71964 RepID=A0ACC0U2V4_9AGAM|nr:Na+ dependent nucleoside transporter C-terminus-domain-containing protein [Russula earlei]